METTTVGPTTHACVHCGGVHSGGVCHRVKAIEYHQNGTVKRVEYHDPRPPMEVTMEYPKDLVFTTSAQPEDPSHE